MTDEAKTREQIEEIVNNNNEETVNEEPVKEEIKEEIKEEVIKPKAKPRPSRAKAKVKITKQPVEQVIEKPVEPVVEEKPVVVEEKPEPKVDKLKTIVQCPDCLFSMTQHTLKYIHKRRGFCKAVKPEPVPKQTPEPIVQSKPKPITEEVVNYYIKQNPDIVFNYLRNERALKAQRKQMNARSLLNNAF